MMSGHGANLIFFNKKNKDQTYRTVANAPPQPTTYDNTSLLPYPPPLPPTPKEDVICVSPFKHV